MFDHDFDVGSKHELIPSDLGDMKVVNSKDLTNDAISYSGPTYIVIISAKDSGSWAFHHFCDMNKVRSLPEFTNSLQDKSSKEKKVMVVTVDEGPGKNPRYTNTINCAIYFSMSTILMRIHKCTNAPLQPQMHLDAVPLTEWKRECLT